MAILSQIRDRFSVRSYKSTSVEQDKLDRVLEAARLAPSANNKQVWRFVVVTDPEIRQQLVPAANNQPFVGEAPVVIACCAAISDYVMRCGQPAYAIDLAIAIDHMTLQAVEEGLGTCWVGSFYEDQAKAVLDIPEEVRIVELLTLGYPDCKQPARNRVPIDEIVCTDKWGF